MKHLFFDDYSEGAHPEVLAAIAAANEGQQAGYANDAYCAAAAESVRESFGFSNADVHFVSGATQANLVGLSSMLRSYQGVIAADSGHIAVHEAGAVEATGHKILTVKHEQGKITPALVDEAMATHEDEHCVMPKVLYLTQATELGTVYTRSELVALIASARRHNLFTYLDGARLAMALAADGVGVAAADVADIGIDMLCIGGTKVGGMFGEAIVIANDELKSDFRYQIKQRGALLAKSRFMGAQFQRFFGGDGLWFALGAESNKRTAALAEGLAEHGVEPVYPCETNQLFVALPRQLVAELQKQFGFYLWEQHVDGRDVVRLVCDWSTPWEAVAQFLADFADLSKRLDLSVAKP